MIYKRVSEEAAKNIRRGIIRIGSTKYYKRMEDIRRSDSTEGIPDKKIKISLGDAITAENFNRNSQYVMLGFKINSSINLVPTISAELTPQISSQKFFEKKSDVYTYNFLSGKLTTKKTVTNEDLINLKKIFRSKNDQKSLDDLTKRSHKAFGEFVFQSIFNAYIFCGYEWKDDDIGHNKKFGKHIFQIINPQEFSDVIASHLLQKYTSNELSTRSEVDTMARAKQKIIYTDKKESIGFCSISSCGIPQVNIDSIFLKPKKYKKESEFRFMWIPYSNKLKMGAELDPRYEYLDICVKNLDKLIRWI